MDTLFLFTTLGGAQKGYFFTPSLLSAQPSPAPDLPSQFLASLFPLLGLSKLPGMFWALSAPVPKGVRDLSETMPTSYACYLCLLCSCSAGL